jgi:hyperosmotically inducible periplasmic protein
VELQLPRLTGEAYTEVSFGKVARPTQLAFCRLGDEMTPAHSRFHFRLAVFTSAVLSAAVLGALLSVPVLVPAVALAQKAPATDAQLTTEIERKIGDLKLRSSRVTVSVGGHVVTLDGTVPTLWLKREVIDRARKTNGIERVDATIEIARAESDEQLAAEVGKRLRNYVRYTVYDFVDGRVRDAVVTLIGAVTMPLKRDEITELLEKTPGVRDIKNGLTVLPVSPSDDRIRAVIATQIYRDPLFVNYSRVNPPIHVIVEHGHVTLIGIVTSQIDRQKAEAVAHMVPGVFSVNNQIRLASEMQGK